MAPIIVSIPSADDVDLGYGKLGHGDVASTPLPLGRDASAACALDAEERDDGVAVASDVGGKHDGHIVDTTTVDGSTVERRQSNLFAEESLVNRNVDSLASENLAFSPAPCSSPPALSLMPSSSPPSPWTTTPSSLEDIEMDRQPFDEFAYLQSQIDADEELARQLQKEEDYKRPTPNPTAKVNVVPSFVDSWLGEPLPSEVKCNYTKVNTTANSSGPTVNYTDSISGYLTKSLNRFTAAATDFFGEDVHMQQRKALSAKGSKSRYRNAV